MLPLLERWACGPAIRASMATSGRNEAKSEVTSGGPGHTLWIAVRLLTRTLLVLAVAVVIATPTARSASASERSLTILVLAGQSNALGYSSYVVDPKTHKDVFSGRANAAADKHVLLMWTETGVTSSGASPVPLDTLQVLSGAPSAVFGPEVGLGRKLYSLGHHNLLIVKVAFSGSSLAVSWQPTAPDFQAMLSRVVQATSWAKQHGWHPVIGGFYWFQGETDAMNATMSAAYSQNLEGLLSNVRTTLKIPATTPIVIGQTDIADFIRYEELNGLCTTPSCDGEWTWNHEVMEAQAAADARHVYVASTASLPRYEDFIHLTNDAELSLGEKFAELSSKHLG